LSAFDSLLMMPSTKQRQPMGSLASQQQQVLSPPPSSAFMQQTSQVKTLSSNDINDLLG
jgi:hypothetical protein